jgi:PAS domain S-box-containing protein
VARPVHDLGGMARVRRARPASSSSASVANAERTSALVGVGQKLCSVGAALGVLALVGWWTGARALTTIVPHPLPMMPNTALSLALLGVAGALARRGGHGPAAIAARTIGTLVLVLALATLYEYAWGVDLGIDEILARTETGPHPGRMSLVTALALACLAAALLSFDARARRLIRPSEWLAMSAWLVAFTAALGHLFGSGPLYPIEDDPVIGVALITSLSLMLVATGLLLQRPELGIMRVATSPGPGGVLLRRLGLAAVFAPVAANLLLSRFLAWFGLEDLPFVYATVAVFATVMALLLLTLTAVPLDRAHEALTSSRARAQALFDDASDAIFVADAEGRYTDVNAAACRLLGYTGDELRGKTILDILPPDEAERFSKHRGRIFAGEHEVSEWMLCRKDGTRVPVEVSAKLLADGRWQAFVRDISERTRAQAQIRQAMERYDLALRGGDLAAWDWDIDTGTVTFNARWAEMRGFAPEEITPNVDSWMAGVHPDDWPRVKQALDDYLEGRTREYEAELRVATKDGGWTWVLDRGRVFARDRDGRPTRMAGTEMDITARKLAEDALRVSEEKFSGIVSLSADAIVSIDENQRITLFNAGAERVFGWTRQEAIGAPLDMLIPEHLREIHRRHVTEFAASPETSRRVGDHRPEIVGLRKNGEVFPAEAAISQLEVGGTRIFTASLRDVSDQRRREIEKELLAELGAALGSTVDVGEVPQRIAELVVRRFADTCVVDVLPDDASPRALHVVARDPAQAWAGELLARLPVDDGRPHLTASTLASRRPELLRRMSPDDIALLSPTEDHLRALRSLNPRCVITVPLLARDEILGALAFLSSSPSRVYDDRDVRFAEEIAQRVSLSIENARLYRAAQRAIRARDEVLGIVAHDLRNPLGVISMHAAILPRVLEPKDAARKAAQTIERSAGRMKRLIEDLLDVTRMEAGRLTIEQDRVSPRELVAETAESQRALAASRALELRVDVASEVPDVWADRDRLVQVLENLVGNAIKFTERGGRVMIGAAPRDRDVLFWVADTGAGIAADDVPHLFDRFWQARRAGRKGAGLGLPIVKGIVEAHGGRVWVDSTPGRGSTFYFAIPRLQSAERSLDGPARPGA